MREIIKIYTRDFNQWTNQMCTFCYENIFPKIWGQGLEDQIIRYTGRSFEWIRYVDDYERLTKYMVAKSLDDEIYREENYRNFKKYVDQIRELISIKPDKIKNNYGHLMKIKDLYIKMYPWYGLCVFVPGQWRDKMIKKHGKKVEGILDMTMQSREHSEGLLKEVDLFMRKWIGLLLEKNGQDSKIVKILSVKELENYTKNNILPDEKILEERGRGFIYIGGKIYPVKDPLKFFKKRNIYYPDLEEKYIQKEFSGTVAASGGIIKGIAKTIFNENEVKDFKDGNILVTPMTSPEFLPAIKKAKAVVTDEGGVSCHAAITARELNIPTVIGTKVATKVLKDGDEVEVDAVKGIVKKIK